MSESSKIERKTKAIMFTDIAGYTQAMSESEQKALEMLRKKRTIIKTLIDNYDGKYVKEIEMVHCLTLNLVTMHPLVRKNSKNL